jgi:hypothetical protein
MIAKFVLLGVLTVTSYRPIASQTKKDCRDVQHCFTSIGDVPTKFGAAASQDLLLKGIVHYGEPIYISGLGWRIVNDTMNPRIHNAIDIMVWTKEEEHNVGVRHVKVWRIENERS